MKRQAISLMSIYTVLKNEKGTVITKRQAILLISIDIVQTEEGNRAGYL